jgi:general secretion pathway protein A
VTRRRREIREAVRELQWTDFASRTNRLRTGINRRRDRRAADGLLGRRGTARVSAHPGSLRLGRTADNDIQLDSRFVSRHHAQLTVGPRNAVIEDLNSTNGIYFGGKRVKRRS